MVRSYPQSDEGQIPPRTRWDRHHCPLVSTGLINPMDAGRTVATFTGGFKRDHGAFKYGPLALKNHGSHYGFMENGVIFSKLQPGLATIYVLNDGWVDMKTWTEEDNNLLPKIKYARQNGVPIIAEFDPVTQLSVPGPLVARWGEGNWSGSVGQEAADDARGCRPARVRREAISHLRLFLECNAIGHGPCLPGLPVPLRHASGYECPGAYLSGRIQKAGLEPLCPASDPGDERSRYDCERAVYSPLPRVFG